MKPPLPWKMFGCAPVNKEIMANAKKYKTKTKNGTYSDNVFYAIAMGI